MVAAFAADGPVAGAALDLADVPGAAAAPGAHRVGRQSGVAGADAASLLDSAEVVSVVVVNVATLGWGNGAVWRGTGFCEKRQKISIVFVKSFKVFGFYSRGTENGWIFNRFLVCEAILIKKIEA